MHEMSIAESILEGIEESLGEKKVLQVVRLTLGPLAGVNADSLQFCFTELAETMGFGKPELDINCTLAKVHCNDCNKDYEAKEFYEGCPDCGSLHREILTGKELIIDSVELMEA